MASLRRRGIQVKSPGELEAMRVAGLLVAAALDAVRAAAVPGCTPRRLDALAEEVVRAGGGIPSFLGYHGYPASLCTSVNDAVVHGIPDDRPLADGDLLSVDCGAVVDGWHGDAAFTLVVGDPSAAPDGALALVAACEDAMWAGIAAARVGARVGDVSSAVERSVRGRPDRAAYGLVAEYTGHGIGTEMHQEPAVPNAGRPGRGPRLAAGMALAIEPMLTLGDPAVRELDDGWTVVTRDGAPAAHSEHTVAITSTGPWVLTAADGGRSRLQAPADRADADDLGATAP